MKTKIHSLGLFWGVIFLLGVCYSFSNPKDPSTIATVQMDKTSYLLKRVQRTDANKDTYYQFFLEIHSPLNPRSNFRSEEEYSFFVQFKMKQLFSLIIDDTSVPINDCRMEMGLPETQIYRFDLYFDGGNKKAFKDFVLTFNDQLFENKEINFTLKKIKI